jgi:hypothetical protein
MLCTVRRGTTPCDFNKCTLDYSLLGVGSYCRRKFVAYLNDPFGRTCVYEPNKLSGTSVVCDIGNRNFGRRATPKSIRGNDTNLDWTLP